MITFVATKNLGKLDEMQAIFATSAFELRPYEAYAEVLEGERSYAENAELKAAALRAQLQAAGIHAAVLADDSGLEVRALGVRPGVLSSRYAGSEADWPARRARLLAEMGEVPSARRGAKFVCAMVLLLADGSASTGYGEVAGEIATAERGEGGFGFDPIFYYPPEGVTFAELSPERKNALSHRRRAAEALLRALASRV